MKLQRSVWLGGLAVALAMVIGACSNTPSDADIEATVNARLTEEASGGATVSPSTQSEAPDATDAPATIAAGDPTDSPQDNGPAPATAIAQATATQPGQPSQPTATPVPPQDSPSATPSQAPNQPSATSTATSQPSQPSSTPTATATRTPEQPTATATLQNTAAPSATPSPTATPTDSAPIAPFDGDSQFNPAVSVNFSPTGQRNFTHSSDVSVPQGDVDDWVQFKPVNSESGTASTWFTLTCDGDAGSVQWLRAILFDNGQQTTQLVFCGDDQKRLTLTVNHIYQLRITYLNTDPHYAQYQLTVVGYR